MEILPVVKLSILASQFLRVQVFAEDQGVEVDPTSFTVQLAFPVQDVAPVGGDWKAATWETTPSGYLARIVVGVGSTVALAVGRYDIWVKVIAAGETPTQRVGVLVVE